MKRLTLVLMVMVTMIVTVYSQTNKEEVQVFQNLFGMEKKAAVAQFIKFNGNADAFWTLYDQYENERKELGLKRVDLISEYAKKYDSLDDVTTDDLINKMITQQKSTNKLIDSYYKKMKKQVGVKQAAQFYQIENYFLAMIRAAIMEQIPLIGELEKE